MSQSYITFAVETVNIYPSSLLKRSEFIRIKVKFPQNSSNGDSGSCFLHSPALYQIPTRSPIGPVPTRLLTLSCSISCPSVTLTGSVNFELRNSIPILLLPKQLYFQELPVIFYTSQHVVLISRDGCFQFPRKLIMSHFYAIDFINSYLFIRVTLVITDNSFVPLQPWLSYFLLVMPQ